MRISRLGTAVRRLPSLAAQATATRLSSTATIYYVCAVVTGCIFLTVQYRPITAHVLVDLLLLATYHTLHTTRYSLSTTSYEPPTTCHLLLTAYYPVFMIHFPRVTSCTLLCTCPLPTTCCSLLTTHCVLTITHVLRIACHMLLSSAVAQHTPSSGRDGFALRLEGPWR